MTLLRKGWLFEIKDTSSEKYIQRSVNSMGWLEQKGYKEEPIEHGKRIQGIFRRGGL